MHWLEIRRQLKAIHISDPANMRAGQLAHKVSKHYSNLCKRRSISKSAQTLADLAVPTLNVSRFNQFESLGKMMNHNEKIVAIDAEWTMSKPITEIGVSVWEDGHMRTFNVSVGATERKFHHGTTRYITDDQARYWLGRMLEDAKLIIGHSFKNDRQQFVKWGFTVPSHIPVLDTASWSKNRFPPNAQKLSRLANFYEVDSRGAHCAGNDARMTFEVALAMREEIIRLTGWQAKEIAEYRGIARLGLSERNL